MDSKQKDFTISLALVALGVYATVEGVRIYLKAAKPPYNITNLSISPALLPIVLGALLLVLSLTLFIKSLAESSVAERTTTLGQWFKGAVKDTDIQMMVGGMVIMAIYSFILVGLLPYWIVSTVFLVALMSFLRATKFYKILLVALIAVGLVILLFQVGFNVSLP
jgi:uncharacterized protein YqhQ